MTVLVLEWCHYWLKIGDSIGIGLHQYQLLRQECVNNINLFNYGALLFISFKVKIFVIQQSFNILLNYDRKLEKCGSNSRQINVSAAVAVTED